MKFTLFIIMSGIFSITGPATSADESALKERVSTFIEAGDTRDLSALEEVLHADFRVLVNQFMGGPDVTLINKEAYIGMVRDEKIGGLARSIEFRHLSIHDHTAVVEVHLESEAALFDSFITLVKDQEGQWQVISDAAYFQPKNP